MAHDELRPFAPAEAETVASWAGLTADDVGLWTMEASGNFTLRRDGDLVAYGEIVEDEVEGDVEIQHLLVAPDRRGVGVGQAILAYLCDFLAASRAYPEVWLRAGRQDAVLLACAARSGFTDVPGMSGPRYLWLKKTLRRLPAPKSGGEQI